MRVILSFALAVRLGPAVLQASQAVAPLRLALERAEAEACYTRTGHHSATTGEWRDGAGLIAGMFTHHISRDGDPQLHVHIAIANLVQRADGADGKYRRLDTRALHNQRLSIAAQVDREMEARLIARGYAMVPRQDGNGCEIGGVSEQVMGLFSARKAALGPGRQDGGGVPPQVRARPSSGRCG
jgi:conjugative relaxase-like TrwC/TraI family protein